MVVRFNLNVDQSMQMDGTMKVVWYPSKSGEWVRYTDCADRIEQLQAELSLAVTERVQIVQNHRELMALAAERCGVGFFGEDTLDHIAD